MKQISTLKHIVISFLVMAVVASCVKYDAAPFTGKSLPRVTEYGNDWLYLNFESGEYLNPKISSDTFPREKYYDGTPAPIYEGDHYSRLDWDIAFNRYNIRTNSGTSGVGKGGAFDMGEIKFSQITEVSQLPKDMKFEVDSPLPIIITERQWLRDPAYNKDKKPWFDPNNGPSRILSSHNTVLAKAIEFLGPPPSYEPSNHIYIIRAADGVNYYKLHIISWYDENVEIGDRDAKLSFYLEKLK